MGRVSLTAFASTGYSVSSELAPDPFKSAFARASALRRARDLPSAVAAFDEAIAHKSDDASAYLGRGEALLELKRFEAAATSVQFALLLAPDVASAHFLMGEALRGLGQSESARACYERALALDPALPQARGLLWFLEMQICDWPRAAVAATALEAALARGENATPPFPMLALADAPALHRAVTERFAQAVYPADETLGAISARPRREKIRVGYYSGDYENHPVAQLIAGVFESHDRSRFELSAFSFGRDAGDDMRGRLVKSFDRFIDARMMSDVDIARQSRALEIDIAVDLTGYTRDRRTGVFACRAAPVQVGYLGYPGTMGAPYFDYIIADKTLIPDESRAFYPEKAARLPHTYQCNDRKRAASGRGHARRALGLPESGFVFCCFNNNYKISPETFGSWARILARAPGAVLWLMEDNPQAAANLRAAAAARGLDPARLVFAPRVPTADHLTRHGAADLLLDTFPYTAHTTASDALWMGVPVLTRPGESFASRVAASLLMAIGLPELIAATVGDYEDMAVAFATGARDLAGVKAKLAANRLSTPLFDTAGVTAHLEALYQAMYDRLCAGLAPDHIDLPAR